MRNKIKQERWKKIWKDEGIKKRYLDVKLRFRIRMQYALAHFTAVYCDMKWPEETECCQFDVNHAIYYDRVRYNAAEYMVRLARLNEVKK